MDLVGNFSKYLSETCKVKHSDSISVGVSGGIDSMVLAHLLLYTGYKFSIAHCNFELRGNESDGDELFVREFAQKHALPFFCKKFNTKQFAISQHISTQMAARQLRLNWFSELIRKENIDYILLAHHLDDQIETFFLNLTRGTGIDGLKGMLPINGKIIRPLLFAKRYEIEKFANSVNIQYREDASNKKNVYTRNKIRLHIIPVLKEIFPDFQDIMHKNINRFLNASNLLSELCENVAKDMLVYDKNCIKYNLSNIKNYANTSELLYQILSSYNFHYSDMNSILKNVENNETTQYFSTTHQAFLKSGIIEINERTKQCEDDEYLIKSLECFYNEKLPLKFQYHIIENHKEIQLKTDSKTALFDYEQLRFPLFLRRWQKGDCFVPYGMKHKKLLSDFFTDLKLTHFEKKNIWLLCNEDEILWVVGKRRSAKFQVQNNSEKILILNVL